MLRNLFLQDIMASPLMIHESGYQTLTIMANAIHEGRFNPEIIPQTIASQRGEILVSAEDDENRNPFDSWQQGSIAVIPLTGIMMKHAYWWSYGVDDIADIIRQAYRSDMISAVIIKTDTPGGYTDSLYLLTEVLSEKIKPTFGYIDGMAASCGYIALSFCDKIYAINPMSYVGSIGVMQRILVPNKENAYYKVIDVYPDESRDKNLPEREAEQGKTEKLKKQLSTLAAFFQSTVNNNRKGLADEVLTGKIYYASEAETIGLIDGIRTFQQVADEINQLVDKRKQLLTLI